MAKLSSLIQFNGSLDGLTIYKLPGVEQPVVRKTWGPTKEDIHTKPRYDLTRRNNKEHGGRSTAVHWLMKAFQPLKPMVDFDTAGQLNKLLRAVQLGDTESEYGRRAVLLSRFPHLLEGFRLTKAAPFDSVVRGEVSYRLDPMTLEAALQWPQLLPGLTFFPPEGYPYCRLVAVLGVAPDLSWALPKYQPGGDFSNCFALSVHTEWFAANADLPSTTFSLRLPYNPPTESFALVLSIGVQFGVPGLTGGVEPVRKRVGSAKILAAV